MRRHATERSVSWLPLALLVLLGLLGLLAWLQFRWTGELGAAERDRLQASLEARASRTVEGFARSLTEVYLALAPRDPFALDSPGDLAARLAAWRASTRHPALVDAIVLVDAAAGSDRAYRLDAAHGSWSEVVSPLTEGDAATALGQAIARRSAAPDSGDPTPPSTLAPEVPAFLFPALRHPVHEGPAGRESARRHDEPLPVTGWQIVLLHREALINDLLVPLTHEQFSADERSESGDLVLLELPDATRRPLLGATGEATASELEVSRDLFRLLRGRELRNLGRTDRDESPGTAPRSFFLRLADGGEARRSGWRLLAGRREGTLDAVVLRTRRRNLALGLGVLVVLGAGVLAAVAAADRARRLASRELEFVAAISHELRTPLAAIRALGENLRDGLARDPERVREYASLILAESERLGGLVEGTLAAARGERTPLRREALGATALAHDAIARCASLPGSAGITLHPPGEGELHLAGERDALVRALVNVLANALRFGGLAPLVDLHVEAAGSERVRFRVADRGPGIPRDEIPHLFEPFFRGRRATELAIPGSGLGLFLVQRTVVAHGGRVAIESREGGGTEVTIELPGSAASGEGS